MTGPNPVRSVRAILEDASGLILAGDLDAANVYRWRHRLADAWRRDADERTHRTHFDHAWQAVKAEWRAAGSPRGRNLLGAVHIDTGRDVVL